MLPMPDGMDVTDVVMQRGADWLRQFVDEW
jgi:DNA primase